MTPKLLYRLLIGHGLKPDDVGESQSPDYYLDVEFLEPVPYTIGYKTKQINSGQFPDEIIDYCKFGPTQFRLYLMRIKSFIE